MDTDVKFNELYEELSDPNNSIWNDVKEIQKREKKNNIAIAILVVLFSILFLIPLGFMAFDAEEYFVTMYYSHEVAIKISVAIISVFFWLLLLPLCMHGSQPNVANLKEEIFKKILKQFDERLKLEPRNGVSFKDYKSAEFEDFYDRDHYHNEYLVTGLLKNGCKLRLSEAITVSSQYSDGGGPIRGRVTFIGAFTKIEFLDTFNSTIYLRSAKKSKKTSFDSTMIDIDFPEFDKNFNVYSSNEISTKQLLTNEILLDILNFYNDTDVCPEITIRNNFMYIRYDFDSLLGKKDFKNGSINKYTLYKYYKTLEFTLCLTNKLAKLE